MTLPATYELTAGDGRVLRYCLYGPADGFPAIAEGGSPSTRWRRPSVIEAMEKSRLRFLVYDRPGYGGSTRRPGRSVADAAGDVQTLADAHGWDRFAMFGGSGGGPHALASAALLPDRVTRCAVLSGIKPADPDKPLYDEPTMRTRVAGNAAPILQLIEDGGPETPWEPGPPARDDPDALARIRATFTDSIDGWVDDSLAFTRPWGLDPEKITVPVGIWHGTDDTTVGPEHPAWLLAHIPGAQGHLYPGKHLPGPDVFVQIYGWLRTGS